MNLALLLIVLSKPAIISLPCKFSLCNSLFYSEPLFLPGFSYRYTNFFISGLANHVTYDSRGRLSSEIDFSLEAAAGVHGPLLFVFLPAEQAAKTFDKVFRFFLYNAFQFFRNLISKLVAELLIYLFIDFLG